jgi:hypothetical protein
MSAPTKLKTFYDALADITVTGVVKKYDNPPASINTADMPSMWVEFPENDDGFLTFGTHGGWPTLRGVLVIATKAVSLATQAENYAANLTIADAVNDALRALPGGTLGQGTIEWTMRTGIVVIGQAEYWGVITEVTAHG